MTLPKALSALAHSEEGAASVEYALLVGGIALAILASVVFMGQVVFTTFFQAAEKLIH